MSDYSGLEKAAVSFCRCDKHRPACGPSQRLLESDARSAQVQSIMRQTGFYKARVTPRPQLDRRQVR
jgi:hypothetical protein